MGFGKSRKDSMSINELSSIVSESKILAYYLGITELPCLIHSPLRVDNHPSLSLNTYDGEHIFFRDFKTQERGNTFNLLQLMWGHTTIQETINKITEELLDNSNLLEPNYTLNSKLNNIKEIKINKTPVTLQVKVREWKDYDIAYWKQYGISLPWLKFSCTYPISHIIITKDDQKIVIGAEKYAYVYVEFKDGVESIKIYQPYSINHKWSNNHDSSVWDLWQQLPQYGDDVIITSSRKDALCIWENTGIPSCSLQAESYFPKKQVVEELKSRFKNVWVLYDNDWEKKDNPGRTLGAKIANEFGLPQIEINQKYLSKDSSDLRKNCGVEMFREVIFKLINK